MIIDFDTISPGARYHAMTQAIIPRPIAWVLTAHENGSLNLAPFSYFTAVSSDPPLLMISAGSKSDGSPKDTRANIAARDHFVVHIPHRGALEAMNNSSAEVPAGISEVDALGLETIEFEGFPLRRLRQTRVALGCTRYAIHELGPKKQALILGQVQRMWVDDDAVTQDETGRVSIQAAGLDPVARLGASQYVGFGEIIELSRPKGLPEP